jgi:hypothetical protein
MDCSKNSNLLVSSHKRKRNEKLFVEDLWIVDENTIQFERERKRNIQQVLQATKEDQNQQLHSSTTEITSTTSQPYLLFQSPQPQPQQPTQFPLPPVPAVTGTPPLRLRQSSTAADSLQLPHTNQEEPSILLPVDSSWWIEYCILPKFQERLRWSWNNRRKSFAGSFPLPLSVFHFFFDGVGSLKSTKQNLKHQKIVVLVKKQTELEEIDIKLGESDKWRRMIWTFRDRSGKEELDGENYIVLKTNKRIDWLGGGVDGSTFITCPCPLVLSYDLTDNLFSFKGTTEGVNSTKHLRY